MKRTTLDKAEKPLSGRSFHIQIICWKSTRNLINRAFQGDNQEIVGKISDKKQGRKREERILDFVLWRINGIVP